MQKALIPVCKGLRSDWDLVKSHTENVNIVSPGLQEHILLAESTNDALEIFLKRHIPFGGRDSSDPVLMIAGLAKAAWRDLWDSGADTEKHKVRFGRAPVDPLVAFIRNALEDIDWAGPGIPGYSDDTISERLRMRPKRPRVR